MFRNQCYIIEGASIRKRGSFQRKEITFSLEKRSRQERGTARRKVPRSSRKLSQLTPRARDFLSFGSRPANCTLLSRVFPPWGEKIKEERTYCISRHNASPFKLSTVHLLGPSRLLSSAINRIRWFARTDGERTDWNGSLFAFRRAFDWHQRSTRLAILFYSSTKPSNHRPRWFCNALPWQ